MAILSAYQTLLIGFLFSHTAAQYGYTDPNDEEAANEAGAAGPSTGSVNISNAGIIALCTIVGVVVVIGISSAILFYVAKKRQWAMREALRRSGRRVVEAIKTPLTPRFPRSARSARPPTRGRDDTHRRERRAREAPPRSQTDPEKDAVRETTDEKQGSERSARGWSSYFSFNRS